MTMTEQANEERPSPKRTQQDTRRSQSPTRSSRHTKGLSLNFPILLPTQTPSVSSPSTASPTTAQVSASPNPYSDANASVQSPSRTSSDFLTSVASQERRVLELREELAKADAELTALKKQWAGYEANKKREEVRQLRRIPVSLDEVSSPVPTNPQDVEEERRRRRALVEMNNNTTNISETTNIGRRGSKRVFEGRHTRTLSLLSPPIKSTSAKSIDELVIVDENRASEESSDTTPGTPSLSRMPTFDGLVSPENLQVAFGKTYKNLAAQRRSLPPGTADMFVKQSKQVVDGVREGLWTFFEDIRQATVGDEAVNGPAHPPRSQRQRQQGSRPTRSKSKTHKPDHSAVKEDSFWKEFGVETPKKVDSLAGHVQQKSSTDSQNPPDLLEDLNGDEEEWERWESPTSARRKANFDAPPLDSDGLPWPELKKMTPSKLTRTASDMMHGWKDGEEVDTKEMPS